MTDAHRVLNASTRAEAAAMLERCCGSTRWVEGMLARLPFASRAALDAAAVAVWAGMTPDDCLEAFSHHPRIGSRAEGGNARLRSTTDWSREEQSSAAAGDDHVMETLRRANAVYEERFGFVFLVCATGRSAPEVVRLLDERLRNDPESELRVAASEQLAITRLRLEKLAR